MKNLNIYFKLQLTSNSPNSQIISLGLVSDKNGEFIYPLPSIKILESKSFYAEFNDFDLNRCDDEVEENVVEKLKFYDNPKVKKLNEAWPHKGIDDDDVAITNDYREGDNYTELFATKNHIKNEFNKWLSQFKGYNIQFIGDKCSWEWVKLVELIGKWDRETNYLSSICPVCDYEWKLMSKLGNPILPKNISPKPMDLNTVIALKKGISVKEASELDRESIVIEKLTPKYIQSGGRNSLFMAEVIKEIYQKLK